jgi:IPT/TIG domain
MHRSNGVVAAVAPAPTVTAIAPTSGAGGISVQITGTNFTAATAVKFGNANALFTVNSATSITATSPAGSGVVDVTVTVAGVTSATGASDQFSYTPAASPCTTKIIDVPGLQAAAASSTIALDFYATFDPIKASGCQTKLSGLPLRTRSGKPWL